MNEELLLSLARSYGFGTSYRSDVGELITPPAQSFMKLLRAIGVPLSESPSDQELQELIDARATALATRPLPLTVVATAGEEQHFNVHVKDGHYAHCWIRLEDGSSRDAYQDENWAPPFTAADGVVWGRPRSTCRETCPSATTSCT